MVLLDYKVRKDKLVQLVTQELKERLVNLDRLVRLGNLVLLELSAHQDCRDLKVLPVQ